MKILEVIETRVQACLRCREYLPILTNDFINQEYEREFRGKHTGHPLITSEEDDVDGFEEVLKFE